MCQHCLKAQRQREEVRWLEGSSDGAASDSAIVTKAHKPQQVSPAALPVAGTGHLTARVLLMEWSRVYAFWLQAGIA